MAPSRNSKPSSGNSTAKSESSATSTAGTTRAAIYARVSTNNGQDVGLQLDELRQVARQRGWVVADEYVDEGISGSTTSRPALDRLLADVQAGRVGVVLCWKLDRLGRSLKHLLDVLDTFTASGVQFVSARDAGIDSTSPTSRLLLQLLACFAEFERSMIQERVVAGVRRAQAKGKHCGRPEVQVADQQLEAARKLIADGWSWRAVSKATGIQKDTLRRRLAETAESVSQNPARPKAG